MASMKLSRAYLAGLVDGEGSIGIYRRKAETLTREVAFTPVFKIGMTGDIAKEIILQMRDKYGGDFWTRAYDHGYKPCHMLAIKGKKILKLLEDVYPHLLVKREQARIILEYFSGDMSQKKWGSQAMPDAEYQRRVVLYEKIKALNLKNRLQRLNEETAKADATVRPTHMIESTKR